jgi:hypothetical protein
MKWPFLLLAIWVSPLVLLFMLGRSVLRSKPQEEARPMQTPKQTLAA